MKITIKINTAADKLADCIARARAIIDALDANAARMPEGSEPTCEGEQAMIAPNDGGPAFPQDLQGRRGDDPQYQGMSLRDWFAGQALAGLLASGHFTTPPDESEIAWMTTHEDPWDDETGEAIHKGRYEFDFPEAAWKCADAMISYKRKEDK